MAEGQELSYFDLHAVHNNFDRSLVEDDDIDVKTYLEAYHELNK